MKRLFTFSILICISFSIYAQSLDVSLFHGMKARNIGPAGMSGRVTAIDVILSNPNTIYIGAAAGNIWKSENRGHTWTPIFEHEKTASIGDIAIYQPNPNLIYVATGEGNPRNSQNSGWGMYKTIDGGRSWQHLGLELTRQIHRVIVHPNNPDIVWAGASGATWGPSEHRGVYKSKDGGKTWTKTLYINDRTGISELVMDPSNPNKLIAGMWEHQRDAWVFKSGGEGSGLYLSYDGGENWKKITTENGLPQGELGRIGLAFAPSNPQIVYAYIESQSNAIYRSEDGGENWKRVSKPKDRNIGGRPFYYAEIYVDTKNENRVYSIASEVTVSEDGGKTWSVFVPGNKVHTDHHAWWSDPEDPNYILLGHDGGLNMTHDRGKKWSFADHLPLAQFYHIRVDNEIPYNVYGGLQDNGSWIGPSQTWFKGGIRNMYWQRVSVGDGFDVVPDPLDNQYGYAMGQAGNLVRYHRKSGQLLQIKPMHPDGEFLRFNWNAGIGISPHDNKTIYYGSQYLHKSEDYGQSWEITSPDLTTNDPNKQNFIETGGLTYDVSGAENHTTIIAIAPSPQSEQVIWVGTDDGNVQVTQDGGKTWTNTVEKIKGLPANTWVPHIKASNFEAGEAFVVFDDHRRNEWTPYVYHTKNFGKSWTRIVDEEDVDGYVYCFEQDPVASNLYFCGTDQGLFISVDAGKNWSRWTHKLPTMPVSDLVVHPRDHDLVIGTFGRSIWILDDIRPLRAIAQSGVKAVLDQPLYAFPAPDAILAIIGESHGYRDGKVGDFLYQGENRAYGSLISYSLKLEEKITPQKLPLEDQVKITIQNGNGAHIRTLYQMPKNGVNRINWKLVRDGIRPFSVTAPTKSQAPRGGFSVPPGNYDIIISYGDHKAETMVKVIADPRLDVNETQIATKEEAIKEFLDLQTQLVSRADRIREIEEGFKFLDKKLKDQPNESLQKMLTNFKEQLNKQKLALFGKQGLQGLHRDPNTLSSMMFQATYLLGHNLVPMTENQSTLMKLLTAKTQAFNEAFDELISEDFSKLKTAVDEAGISILE